MLALALAVTLSAGPVELASGGKALALAFSADESLLALGVDKGNVQVWKLAKKEKTQNLALDRSTVVALAFSSDGKWLAAGDSSGHIVVWTVADGEKVTALKLSDAIDKLMFSPDNKLLAVACSAKCSGLYGTGDWKEATPLDAAPVAWSGDGKRLFAATREAVSLWGRDGKKAKEFATANRAFVVVPEPDFRHFLARSGLESEVARWDTGGKEPKELGRLKGHAEGINSLSLSRDGRRALTGSADHTVRLWDVTTLKQLDSTTFPGATGYAVISPSGRQAAAADGEVTHVWALK